MFNDLSPKMQERLEKWKANVLPVPSAEKIRSKPTGVFVPRHRDYGDDIKDIEAKQEEMWKKDQNQSYKVTNGNARSN